MINREINSSLKYTPAMIPSIQFLQYENILTEIIYPQFTTLKIISISFVFLVLLVIKIIPKLVSGQINEDIN